MDFFDNMETGQNKEHDSCDVTVRRSVCTIL